MTATNGKCLRLFFNNVEGACCRRAEFAFNQSWLKGGPGHGCVIKLVFSTGMRCLSLLYSAP